jgi:hypothetical protein
MGFAYVLLVMFISAILGRKKPIIGSVIGCIATLAIYFYTNDFQIKSFAIAILMGFSVSFGSAFLFSIVASGFRGGNHNTGPSYWGLFRNNSGNIVLTDEEIKGRKK